MTEETKKYQNLYKSLPTLSEFSEKLNLRNLDDIILICAYTLYIDYFLQYEEEIEINHYISSADKIIKDYTKTVEEKTVKIIEEVNHLKFENDGVNLKFSMSSQHIKSFFVQINMILLTISLLSIIFIFTTNYFNVKDYVVEILHGCKKV